MSDNSLKVLAEQLWKNAARQPGWVPLLAVMYAAVSSLDLPKAAGLGGSKGPLTEEVLAGVLTLVFYKVGDAIDKVTFKKRVNGKWVPRYKPQSLEDAKSKARSELEITDGSYAVAMSILNAADDFRLSVHGLNEAAKFLRSLLLPSLLLLLYLTRASSVVLRLSSAILGLGAVLFLARWIYPRLKTLHITNLYLIVPELKKLSSEDGKKKRLLVVHAIEARFFFWDGLFVACGADPKLGHFETVSSANSGAEDGLTPAAET